MPNKINTRIQFKHDTETNWNKATNFIPLAGELIIYDKDSKYNYERFKIGDGTTKINSLSFIKLSVNDIINLPSIKTVVGATKSILANNAQQSDTNTWIADLTSTKPGSYSWAEGNQSVASGEASHASGYRSLALGGKSNAGGTTTIAKGENAEAHGQRIIAFGNASHAEGGSSGYPNYSAHIKDQTLDTLETKWETSKNFLIAGGQYSHAEGSNTFAKGVSSHAEGSQTKAQADVSHAEGYQTIASANNSHAEGMLTTASGQGAHSEGYYSKASANYSHAEGNKTTASNIGSHAEGQETISSGTNSHSEGWKTQATNSNAHAEGAQTIAFGNASHAEGIGAAGEEKYYIREKRASNEGYLKFYVFTDGNAREPLSKGNVFITDKNVIGYFIDDWVYDASDCGWITTNLISDNNSTFFKFTKGIAVKEYTHVEGENNIAYGVGSHAEGKNTIALKTYSHSEGIQTKAFGINSHAEGNNSKAEGEHSHVEGYFTYTGPKANQAHAEGSGSEAYGSASHAEGSNTIAKRHFAHSEGRDNLAAGGSSHVEGGHWQDEEQTTRGGGGNIAYGYSSHAEGISTQAGANLESYAAHAEGQYTKALGAYSHAEGSGAQESTAAGYIEIDATGTSDGISNVAYWSVPNHTPQINEVIILQRRSKPTRYVNVFITGYSNGQVTLSQPLNQDYYDVYLVNKYNMASGVASHAEGYGTTATGDYQHVQGKFNIEDTENKYAHIIGNGNQNQASNAHTVDWDGNAWYAGNITIGTDKQQVATVKQIDDITIKINGQTIDYNKINIIPMTIDDKSYSLLAIEN